MVDKSTMETSADVAAGLASNDKYGDRVKHWQAKVVEIDPENQLGLNGLKLGSLATIIGLDTPTEAADIVFDQVVKILHADVHTNFDDIIRDLKEKSSKG